MPFRRAQGPGIHGGKWLFAAISLLFVIFGCNFPPRTSSIPKVQIQLINPLPIERKDVPVVLTLAQVRQVAPDFALNAYVVAEAGKSGEHIPSQAEDTDYDGELDTLVFLVDMAPQQTRQLLLHYQPQNMRFTLGYDKRTRAGIFPELQGPVWESEQIAYRLLPGLRVDVLGKQERGLQINRWIQETAQQIPLPSLLGKSAVGCGTFRLWDTPPAGDVYERVLVDGPVRSTVQVIGDGFRADLSVYAGHTWMETRVYSGEAEVAALLPAQEKLIRNEADGFVYTWGKQTTYQPEDRLGLAIFYPRDQLVAIQEAQRTSLASEKAHVLRLKPDENGYAVYRTLAIWDHGFEGIADEEAFVQRLKVLAELFRNPLEVKLSLPPEKTSKKR